MSESMHLIIIIAERKFNILLSSDAQWYSYSCNYQIFLYGR